MSYCCPNTGFLQELTENICFVLLMASDLFLKRLNFRNSAPENTVFKNMELHQTGSLFRLLICHEECTQLSNGEGETEVERSLFGVKLECQKTGYCRKAFSVSSAEMEVLLEGLWKATASKVCTFPQDAVWDGVNFTCSLYLDQVGCALPLSLVQLLPLFLAEAPCVAFFLIKSLFCCWIRTE